MQVAKLEIHNISKVFESNGNRLHVLDSISINVKEKEFLTILGPSGCGKTTLIRIIAGLELPTSGDIILDGIEINKPSKKIGYVPQEYSLFPWKNIESNIKFGLKLQGVRKINSEKKIEELLKLIGLREFRNFYPKDISGGMRQKVAIARALAIDQTVLLLDEPLISIDAQTRNKLQDEILEIWKKSKRTIVFVTHNIDEAVYLSDRIIILSSLPANVKRSIPINLQRPRNRTGPQFNQIRKEILDQMAVNI
ncbi:MAG: ABC transporter ATP-binding protein [Candidatus Thorarchaeota archaeon]